MMKRPVVLYKKIGYSTYDIHPAKYRKDTKKYSSYSYQRHQPPILKSLITLLICNVKHKRRTVCALACAMTILWFLYMTYHADIPEIKLIRQDDNDKRQNSPCRTTTFNSTPVATSVDLYFLEPDVMANFNLCQLKEESLKYNLSNIPRPKRIHQSWKSRILPPRFKKWSATWKKCFPDWDYEIWTDQENEWLVRYSFPWFYDTYKKLIGVQKADALRYLYLFVFGGIYADLDDECLNPFDHLLRGHPLVFGAMEQTNFEGRLSGIQEGFVQNSFMYSVPGHPFWLDVIENIMVTNVSKQAEYVTGSYVIQAVIQYWRKGMSRYKHHEVKIYESKYFNPYSWITGKFPFCNDLNKMNSTDIEKCKANFPEAYVIQYHTQTWNLGYSRTNRSD